MDANEYLERVRPCGRERGACILKDRCRVAGLVGRTQNDGGGEESKDTVDEHEKL